MNAGNDIESHSFGLLLRDRSAKAEWVKVRMCWGMDLFVPF